MAMHDRARVWLFSTKDARCNSVPGEVGGCFVVLDRFLALLPLHLFYMKQGNKEHAFRGSRGERGILLVGISR